MAVERLIPALAEIIHASAGPRAGEEMGDGQAHNSIDLAGVAS
jgi:hypothetical protein